MSMEKAIARAWTDAEYKAKLLSDPKAALAEIGVDVPANTTLKVVENTADTQYLVLPDFSAANDEISLDDLEQVAGGLAVQSNNTLAC